MSQATAPLSPPQRRAAKPIDGRIARGIRTRESVILAFEALIRGGEPAPTAAQVAERAGVSCRSIFTHFGDMDGVVCAVARRQVERLMEGHEPVSGDLPLAERLPTFVEGRADALEDVTPLFRTTLLQEPLSAEMKSILRQGQEAGRTYTLDVFGRELARLEEPARTEVTEAIIATTEWPHWNGMRRYQSLSRETARAVMLRELRALLAAA